jgi:ABC-type uncharacterized transport system fused permease/ATPase subunit
MLTEKPRFVFLDEASSSLDLSSEAMLYRSLAANLPFDTTVLAISHRYDREGIRSLCTQVRIATYSNSRLAIITNVQVLELDHGKLTKFEDIYFL